MRWAIWSASALLLAGCLLPPAGSVCFHPLPEIVATLPGDESEFSREFDGRIRERFVIGSSEDKLIDFLVNEGFFPIGGVATTRTRASSFRADSYAQKIVRVLWRADAAGILTEVRGSYQSHCI